MEGWVNVIVSWTEQVINKLKYSKSQIDQNLRKRYFSFSNERMKDPMRKILIWKPVSGTDPVPSPLPFYNTGRGGAQLGHGRHHPVTIRGITGGYNFMNDWPATQLRTFSFPMSLLCSVLLHGLILVTSSSELMPSGPGTFEDNTPFSTWISDNMAFFVNYYARVYLHHEFRVPGAQETRPKGVGLGRSCAA